jgi:ribosome-associated protein
MEDMLLETENQIAGLLREHKGQDVLVLDLRGINNWTDFFIITTVSSKTHMDGLERHIREFCREKEIFILGNSLKRTDDEWRLIDIGSCVIHLMTARIREFYELERLWTPYIHPKDERIEL